MEDITNETDKEQQAQNFEDLKYHPLENSGNILLDNSSDPDSYFYNTNIQNLNTHYILSEELQNFLGDDKDENLSVLHLNIRSINKNFEKLKMYLSNLNLSLSIIYFSKTWLNDSNVDKSNYEIPNYVSIHQIRSHCKGGMVSTYIQKNFEFKIRNNLSVNCKDIESIGVQLLHKKKKNTLFNVAYRPPNCKIEPFENFLKILFNKSTNSNKNYQIAGGFNLYLLDHDKNKKLF